jgi:phenylalanyl-tRNA synthetase beta chain
MIVSWNWLKDYVELDMSADEFAHRLAMAGLNHESTTAVGDDLAIDLEVTSNRPDCLGHLGVAREVSVLWHRPLQLPPVDLPRGATLAEELIKLRIDCPDLCRRYMARVIRGVKVGPSPDWLVRRLATLGIAAISNIVDVTNYVMMECGQPLHAFDYRNIQGQQIVVRSANSGESFAAIDHHTYPLRPGMCVIADARRAVALGGVMGGADTEVSDTTRDVLVEAADFDPLSIRTTARALRLHSPSSYRFERGVDPDGTDWASRRACQLMLELAGGELAEGAVDVLAQAPSCREPIVLRYSQIQRILGIDLPRSRVLQILGDLGIKPVREDARSAALVSPSWRRDLTREIDLIEEVGRIHGYDEIPEDVGVPMAPSQRQPQHRVLACVREVLTARGFNEALTVSVVDEKLSECFSPWTDAQPIRCSTPLLRGADCLRRSLVPSLLEARRLNESLANETIELFETAKVYLPADQGLPNEPWMLALTSGEEFRTVKGVIETVLKRLHVSQPLSIEPFASEFLEPQQCGTMLLGQERFGLIGTVSAAGRKRLGLRRPTVVAEVKLDTLVRLSELVPQYQPLSPYPAIQYDFNFIVAERVSWSELAATVTRAGGDVLESIAYQETYRDPERDGPGCKRLLLSVRLRSAQRTLTGEEADGVREAIIQACQQAHGARLL